MSALRADDANQGIATGLALDVAPTRIQVIAFAANMGLDAPSFTYRLQVIEHGDSAGPYA